MELLLKFLLKLDTEKPLIINIYKSSIFITNDYKLNNNLGYASYLIMTSINLKISVKKGLFTYGSLINSFQIFNDDEYYYHFYRNTFLQIFENLIHRFLTFYFF